MTGVQECLKCAWWVYDNTRACPKCGHTVFKPVPPKEEPLGGLVQRVDEVFTEEALKEQDGKTVPLTMGFGGPVVGEATLKYDPEDKALKAEFQVEDDNLAEFLRGPMPTIFKKES